jgi:hypothetical protein
MRKELWTLAIAALLGAPFAADAETSMPSGKSQGGVTMGGSQAEVDNNKTETVKAEIVDIDGERVITETENGEELVFLVEGSAESLNVGDEVELKLDHQAQAGVILNVFPKDQDRKT